MVVDGSVITSRGPGTALEFALTLVKVGLPASASLCFDCRLVAERRVCNGCGSLSRWQGQAEL